MKEEFIEFLKEYGVSYESFVDTCYTCQDMALDFNESQLDEMLSTTPEDVIAGLFLWELSEEGFEFWSELDYEWSSKF